MEGVPDTYTFSYTLTYEISNGKETNSLEYLLETDAASGTTPYVIGALEGCNTRGIATGCITCNAGSPLATTAKYPVVVIVGPEFVTGSSRMKAGTAQKLVLNMISTTAMIQLGRVKGNKMVDMQLSNNKLVDRGTRMVMDALNISEAQANELLLEHQSVRKAIEAYKNA
ncbi:MAG: N-acetylmuramic acid 6-phosphate etherase [Flavobacterium sp.]|nr:MAG: N-acetylmuramic acid 6-phosphate etherase [Flavobacterium sp.]